MALPSLACGSVLKHVLISTLILVGAFSGKVWGRFRIGFREVSGRFREGFGQVREGFGKVSERFRGCFFFGEVSGRFRGGSALPGHRKR